MNNLRKIAHQLSQAALAAVEPKKCVEKALATADFSGHNRIFMVAFGKAAPAMAEAVIEKLGKKITKAIIITQYQNGRDFPYRDPGISLFEAGHPLPDGNSVTATKEVTVLLKTSKSTDLIVFLISGGGSTLLTYPVESITLAEMQKTTQLLLRSGANIHEVNTIRKHLDLVKGGQLLTFLQPKTKVISFILSDVIGDDLSVIASGPTAPDKTTFKTARQVLKKYNLSDQIPSSVLMHIYEGRLGRVGETLKKADPRFQTVENIIVGNNYLAAKSAKEMAEQLGFNTLLLTTSIQGEAKEVGKMIAAIAKDIARADYPVKKPACVVIGGETTVMVKGNGLGGRNQELVLSAALEIDGLTNTLIYAINTDGTDGPNDAAGAIADGTTLTRAKKKKLNLLTHLKNNDSYNFFKPLGDLILTGPTGTNVNDLIFVLVK